MHLGRDRTSLPMGEVERQISVRIFDNDTGDFSLLRYNMFLSSCNESRGKPLG